MFTRTRTHSVLLLVGSIISFAPQAHAAIKTAKGCISRVAKPGKRKACMACVARPRPHQFTKAAAAGRRCMPYKLARALKASANATTAIKTHAGCKARVLKPQKRGACAACVSRRPPHGYFKMAKPGNRCKRLVGRVKPGKRMGPVGRGIRKPRGCKRAVARPAKRKACLICISRPRPHAYFKKAAAGTRCHRISGR